MVRDRVVKLIGSLTARRGTTEAPDRPPFVHVMPDGRVDLEVVNEQAALQCALSRLCGHCAESQGFPLVFAGPTAELETGPCRRPGMHEACARLTVERFRAAGLVDVPWALWASGSFTVERPQRRDEQAHVRFRPGPLLWTEKVQMR